MSTTARSTTGPAGPDHSVWVGLSYDDPFAARAWLRGLGFVEGIVVDGEAPGEIRLSEMLWPEGGRVMVSSRTKVDATPRGDRLRVARVLRRRRRGNELELRHLRRLTAYDH